MKIQINTDRNLDIHESFGNKLKDMLAQELSKFSEHITRLEVHFSDENGGKGGPNDKKCLIEARLESKQPIAVTEVANSYVLAVSGAIDALKNALENITGRR